jgi:hypothetical protein
MAREIRLAITRSRCRLSQRVRVGFAAQREGAHQMNSTVIKVAGVFVAIQLLGWLLFLGLSMLARGVAH